MSFPYHQYVDYSNPATPRVYAWEVASATSDQDPTLQLQQPQDPQAQAHTPLQQPQQQISPSQLQLHQLPPPLLQHAQPSTPQEHQVQQQQQQQQQRQQYPTHRTIHVQPPPPTTHQYRFETVTEEDFMQASASGERPGSGSSRSGSGRRGASKPPLHVDTSRRASSSAAASPGAPSASGTGRVPHARTHVQSAHPYRRPQSRAASGGAGSGAGASTGAASSSGQQHAAVRSRRVSELQSAQTSVGGVSASHTGGALPTVGTPLGVSCPAASSWREGLLGLSTSGQGQSATGTSLGMEAGSAGSGSATPRAQADPLPQSLVLPFPLEPVKRYGIRADVHFSTEENLITAMFELPGVKRDDLRITMSVCPFTRVRQVSVSGISRGVLPLQGHQVRERKFGQFSRALAVPPETKPEDVSVNLEDGVLTLKIPGGTPAEAEQPQSLPILVPMAQ
ncbi:hypothetical protein BD311DRAFT_656835 [Dichomitus squalens]|uniref:SHSP domain-containing protein n=1 Tax=Dichomitus squalens TaxID=114155 RepID=A0A4Q9MYK5_9APHY|nr:hypothetical protein BD311DRAFT_656835 [Dichomitus squalens]